jgi:hypothetical protein
MSRIIGHDQTSDLWQAARVGRITGSRIPDLLAPPTTRASTRKGVSYPAGSEAQVKEDYRNDLVIERIYWRAVDHATNKAMKDGTEREPFARELYGAELFRAGEIEGPVEQVGFCLHPEWDWLGCSPDGLVDDIGGVELKSPTEPTHDAYCRDVNLLVEAYKGQVLSGFTCFPKRQWWDLCSFQPYAPNTKEIPILLRAPRFYRSDWQETIAKIEDEAKNMNAQVEAAIAKRGLPPTEWRIMP